MGLWKRDVEWVAEAAERIGCHGLGDWLPGFADWGEFTPAACPPTEPSHDLARYASLSRGLRMLLRSAFAAQAADPEHWVLHELEIDAARLPLPFGLDVERETPQGARRKLSADTAFGRCADLRADKRRIVHFLKDGRVVGVDFKAPMVGIESVLLQRVVAMPDFRTMKAGTQ